MKRVWGSLPVIILAAAISAFGAQFKGTISDKMCAGDHRGEDPAKCTLSCVEHGSLFVLVISKDKVLTIENQKDARISTLLRKYAGREVTVTGTTNKEGRSIKLEKITI
ncbi:MAG TPA: hypothetical protein VE398_01945 [Acidobacteriota bacterium]|nr:hypothetical protein [Acidobacteriota bacterium]